MMGVGPAENAVDRVGGKGRRIAYAAVFGQQPDWPTVDWSRATWRMNDAPFVPDLGKTLAEQGVAHKAFLTLTT